MKKILVLTLTFFSIAASLFAGQKDNENILKLSLPEKTWALEINVEGFKVQKKILSSDGSAMNIFLSNKATGLNMSVYLEKALKAGDKNTVRDYYWEKEKSSPLEKEDIKMWEFGEMAISEYLIKKVANKKINMKNVNAYLVKEDIWVDIHLSKIEFESTEDKLFKEVLKTVKFINNYEPDISFYFGFASSCYLQENYRDAIKYYEKALNFEKKAPQLDQSSLRVLIDNLGMSYGISGELIKAKEIFEYGIKIDSTYPMFYYNLACTYGEMDNEKEMIENLRKAIKYKDNMISGEKFPDPRKDSSFQRFVNDEQFLKVIEELKQ